ncbi:MAG: TetR/AcrR family transcriptional regulator [Actinomycetota bacterium]
MSPKLKPHLSEFEPLPRGRHRLSPEEVRASQRERLLRAMLECVSRDGYADTTVPEVVAAARVSRNAFYELFADKTECFLALCDELANELLGELFRQEAAPDWIEALRSGLSVYLRWWQDRPEFGRTYLVELPSAGAKAVEQRTRQYASFRVIFEQLGSRARKEQPGLPPLSPLAPRLLVVATTELIAEEVRAGRGGRLVALHDELLPMMVKLLADDETAERAVARA